MTTEKLKVGDTLYCLSPNNYGRTQDKIEQAEITKVGIKYYTLSDGKKPDIETLKYEHPQYTQYSRQYYRNMQELKEAMELTALRHKYHDVMTKESWNANKRTKEQIEAVLKVLESLPS